MIKILKPLIFIGTVISVIAFSTGCKKCIICTVKDVNSGKPLYITPEKCGKQSDFDALKDSVDKAYYCWGCAIYDSVAYDTIANLTDKEKLDSTFVMSLDSFKITYSNDTVDSIKCGSVVNLEKQKNLTTKLVRTFLQNNNVHLKCFNTAFPVKTECD